MRISLGPFRGRVPRVSERALPDQNATIAQGVDLRSGEIRPFRKSALVEAIGSGNWGTIYRWYEAGGNDHWLRFPAGVDVIQGPVADDVWQRIYWTGDSRFDEPRMSFTGPIQTGGGDMPNVSYKMGVPAPGDFLQVAPDPEIQNTVSQIHRERPIRVVTNGNHGLKTGGLVQFSVVADAPSGDENDLAQLLNGNDFQIRVIEDDEFILENTDAFNVEYSAFQSGTVTEYFDPGFLEKRFYVYTYVTELGEEGPPSEPVDAGEFGPGQVATITIPPLDPLVGQGRLIESIRVYRSVTGNQSAQFQFVGELPVAETELVDDKGRTELGESLPSAEWDPPPEDLLGLRVAAQGFAVGFFDNVVTFSEPYMVHAWPTSYQLALDYDVVAIEVVDNGVVVGTTGRPYIIQGIEPRSMSPRRLENNYACVSKASMVTLGYAAIYATNEGLVVVRGGSADLLTRTLMTEKDWAEFAPETITAFAHQGRYVGFYDAGGGNRRGFIIDPREPELGLIDLGVWAKAGFIDARERFLYLLLQNNDIVRWDDPAEDAEPYLWRSKRFAMSRPRNMAFAKLNADNYPATFRLYADGVQRHEVAVSGPEPFPLPSGYLAREFEFEIEGEAHAQDLQVSDGYQEIL